MFVLTMASKNEDEDDDKSILESILNNGEVNFDSFREFSDVEMEESETIPMDIEIEDNEEDEDDYIVEHEEGEIREIEIQNHNPSLDGQVHSFRLTNSDKSNSQNQVNSSKNQKVSKSKRKRNRQKTKNVNQKNEKFSNVPKFVHATCHRLKEPKIHLVWNAVKVLGLDTMNEFINEVEAIERCGGQMTSDGKRRRSPGGVLWNILKMKLNSDTYDLIMSKEMQKQKEKKKSKMRKLTDKSSCDKLKDKNICVNSQLTASELPKQAEDDVLPNQNWNTSKPVELDRVSKPTAVFKAWEKAVNDVKQSQSLTLSDHVSECKEDKHPDRDADRVKQSQTGQSLTSSGEVQTLVERVPEPVLLLEGNGGSEESKEVVNSKLGLETGSENVLQDRKGENWKERTPVKDRIRLQVCYDDLIVNEKENEG